MNPLEIIEKYYDKDSKLYRILTTHSRAVAEKALAIAANVPELDPDLKFIEEAAMLHDIGIYLTDTPEILCTGNQPYITHGYLGAEILRKEGYPRHAKVCERHVGTGISIADIERQDLLLPKREMLPKSIEEEIICLADKFFSKKDGADNSERPLEKIRAGLARISEEKVQQFDQWLEKYKIIDT